MCAVCGVKGSYRIDCGLDLDCYRGFYRKETKVLKLEVDIPA